MQEVELERKRHDLEQLLDTRLAGNAARARALTEQAERAIRFGVSGDPRPECEKPPLPTEYDMFSAELKAALNSTASRLRDEQRSYDERLRDYESYGKTDSQKIEMYFAAKVQRNAVLDLRSKGRSLVAISGSYGEAMPRAATAVVMAACLTRERSPAGDRLAEALSSELRGLIADYRQLLYATQR